MDENTCTRQEKKKKQNTDFPGWSQGVAAGDPGLQRHGEGAGGRHCRAERTSDSREKQAANGSGRSYNRKCTFFLKETL